jgi:hypothetical protein
LVHAHKPRPAFLPEIDAAANSRARVHPHTGIAKCTPRANPLLLEADTQWFPNRKNEGTSQKLAFPLIVSKFWSA